MHKNITATELVNVLKGNFSVSDFSPLHSATHKFVDQHVLFTKCQDLAGFEFDVMTAHSRETGNLLSVTGLPVFDYDDERPEFEKAVSLANGFSSALSDVAHKTIPEDTGTHFVWSFPDGELTLSVWENSEGPKSISLNFIH